MKVVLSTNTVHARDRLATWQKGVSEIYFRHDFATELGPAFEGVIRAAHLGSLPISLLEVSACSGERSQTVVCQDRDDHVFVGFQLSGRMVLSQDGRVTSVAPNSFVLLDSRRPCSVVIPQNARSLVLRVPRSEFQARLGDVSSFTANSISSSKPTAALAAGFLTMAAERVSAIRSSDAGDKIAKQTLDLVALAFETEGGSGQAALSSPRRATLLRLKALIEAKLRDPSLKPAHVAAAAGISVRYANVLLAEEGTSLERFIMQRRLENCRRILMDPAQASRTVSDVAYSWGFADVSHFNRRFKAHFGCSPGQARPRSIGAAS